MGEDNPGNHLQQQNIVRFCPKKEVLAESDMYKNILSAHFESSSHHPVFPAGTARVETVRKNTGRGAK